MARRREDDASPAPPEASAWLTDFHLGLADHDGFVPTARLIKITASDRLRDSCRTLAGVAAHDLDAGSRPAVDDRSSLVGKRHIGTTLEQSLEVAPKQAELIQQAFPCLVLAASADDVEQIDAFDEGVPDSEVAMAVMRG